MCAKLASLSVLGAFLTCADAPAQGLLALQNQADFRESQPLTLTLGAGGGYDRLNYKSSDNGVEDINSYFIQGAVGALYSDADAQTRAPAAPDARRCCSVANCSNPASGASGGRRVVKGQRSRTITPWRGLAAPPLPAVIPNTAVAFAATENR